MYLESSRWRLLSLDPGQQSAIGPSPSSLSPANPALLLAELDRKLLDRLVRDGRLSWIELAQDTGSSTATVPRRVNKLVASGIVTFRCEIANSFAGCPIQASLLAQAPAKDLDAICSTLAAWPESRLVAAVTSRPTST
ncbi:MAG TPA: AsnC family transcriptional regulator [Arthrobacter sp.]|nr:AsnC family transcriptional regulator [Arthrobacter sp.]